MSTPSSNRYLVTTQIGSHLRERVWDSHDPLPIGTPFRWALENTLDGVRIRDLSASPNEIHNQALIRLSRQQIEDGSFVSLPSKPGEKPMKLRLRKIKPVPAAYRASQNIEPTAKKAFQLFAFAGVRSLLISSIPFHSGYVGYYRRKPVFTLREDSAGLHIQPLLSGVQIKFKGQKAVHAQPGTNWDIKKEEIERVSIVRGWYWWRFRGLQLDQKISVFQDAAQETEIDEKTFRKALWAIALALLAMTAVVIRWPNRAQVVVENTEGQVVKLIPPQAPPMKAPEKKPEPPKPMPLTEKKPVELKDGKAGGPKAGAPDAKGPQRPKITQSPIKRPPPPVVSAKPAEAPKPAKVQLAPAPPKPSPAEIAAAQAAAQAKLLKEALGGAATLVKKDALGKFAAQEKGGAAPSATSMFDSSSPGLGTTKIKTAYAGSGGTVGKMASGNGAANYGDVEQSPGAGEGGSFVSFNPGDGMVEEGLTKEEVGAVIHSHMAEVRYCHESALVANPKTEGKLMVGFVINASGAVTEAKPESSTVPDKNLETCIIKRLRTWKFPKPKGGVTVKVSYPFVFKVLGGSS